MAIGGKEFKMDLGYFPPCLSIDILIGAPDLKTKVLYKITDVLLDTGSDLTLIPNKLIRRLKLKPIGERELESFNGDIAVVEYYLCRIIIEEIVDDIFEVGGINSDAMIGMDLMRDWHILMNCPKGTFEIANKLNYNLQNKPEIR